jgi:hypothetical protein
MRRRVLAGPRKVKARLPPLPAVLLPSHLLDSTAVSEAPKVASLKVEAATAAAEAEATRWAMAAAQQLAQPAAAAGR